MNAMAVAWLRLHAISCLGCTEHVAYGPKPQARRDVLFSTRRPLHIHKLNSWRSVLAGWCPIHQLQDAGEMLEHWVGVGRPQVVAGKITT